MHNFCVCHPASFLLCRGWHITQLQPHSFHQEVTTGSLVSLFLDLAWCPQSSAKSIRVGLYLAVVIIPINQSLTQLLFQLMPSVMIGFAIQVIYHDHDLHSWFAGTSWFTKVSSPMWVKYHYCNCDFTELAVWHKHSIVIMPVTSWVHCWHFWSSPSCIAIASCNSWNSINMLLNCTHFLWLGVLSKLHYMDCMAFCACSCKFAESLHLHLQDCKFHSNHLCNTQPCIVIDFASSWNNQVPHCCIHKLMEMLLSLLQFERDWSQSQLQVSKGGRHKV